MVSNAKLAKVWFLAPCQVRVRDFVKHDKPGGIRDKMGRADHLLGDKIRVDRDGFS